MIGASHKHGTARAGRLFGLLLSLGILIPSGAALGGVGGSPDIVVANNGTPNRVCVNDGTGSFTCQDISTVNDQSNDVALTDLDEDGLIDAIFANSGVNRVCINQGHYTFSCSDVSSSSDDSQGVALGDFDGDGHVDAVFANFIARNEICLNNGSGGFACTTVDHLSQPNTDVAVGDFDGQFQIDIVFVTDAGNGRVCLEDGTSAGTFDCTYLSLDTLDQQAVGVIDQDSMNLSDIFIGDGSQQENQLCLNDGTGSFTCQNADPDFYSTMGVANGRLDQMLPPDWISANCCGDPSRVCLNVGGPPSCTSIDTPAKESLDVALGDVDRDGDLDAVFANNGQRNRVCLNAGGGTFANADCSDVSTDTNASYGVALASMGDPNAPALSPSGVALAALILLAGIALASRSRRRAGRRS